MAFLMVSHKVKDFDTWKVAFDEDSERRAEAGLKKERVYRSLEDKNHIYVTFRAKDPEAIQKMMSNPDMAETMEKAGVLSQPVVTVLQRSK